jgi:hypothetical protein
MKPLEYFKSPFPRAAGFSPYRMPGMAVHLPIIVLFCAVGALLCHQSSWALFPLYLIAGVYLGRDWAIAAHYNPLITLLVWGASLALPQLLAQLENAALAGWRAGLPGVAVALGFTGHVLRFLRRANQGED